jgi:hypothetical protein
MLDFRRCCEAAYRGWERDDDGLGLSSTSELGTDSSESLSNSSSSSIPAPPFVENISRPPGPFLPPAPLEMIGRELCFGSVVLRPIAIARSLETRRKALRSER